MARPRRKAQTATAPQVPTAPQEQETQTQTVTKERNTMALSTEEIQNLLSGTRTKGAGTEVISQFIASENAGEEVDLTSGPLAGKSPGQAYTTLVNAKKRTKTNDDGSTELAMPEARQIRIVKKNQGTKDNPDWHVYLFNMELVEVDQ